MGAVAAAVLGAPISTTLIVFELTGDWQIGLAVMVSVSMSTALASRLVDRSFFLTQLEKRNLRCAAGPQAYLLGTLQVGKVMRPIQGEDPEAAELLMAEGVAISPEATLEAALPIFDRADLDFIPVVHEEEENAETGEPALILVGVIYHIDALKAYNRALVAISAEEHR